VEAALDDPAFTQAWDDLFAPGWLDRPVARLLHGLAHAPDTIRQRFNRAVDRQGLPRIRLHDMRTPTRLRRCGPGSTRRS
jgi:hypothetical protein